MQIKQKRSISFILLAFMLSVIVCNTVACNPDTGKESDSSNTEESSTTLHTEESKNESEDNSTVNNETTNEALIEIESETESTAETEMPVAGTNTELVRDGRPHKYFTLSFDDGITQDLKIIEILNKYGVKCATFNINTGLYGANWEWVGQALGDPTLTHQRFTKKELQSGIYNGFDVEVHTLNHPSLKNYDNTPSAIKREVAGDAANIAKITGIKPVGMAWPGGDTEYTDKTIEIILANTDIRFARATTATNGFKLPEYFMVWTPSCSISDHNCLDLAQQFLDAECNEDMLFYVWGHGYELDFYKSYDKFEQLVKMMAEADDVVLVTNAEFYQLFKDQIPSWKKSEN